MRIKNALILLAIIISIAINLITFKNGHGWSGDSAGYILQSQAIKNNSFHNLKYHIERTDYTLNYPWGYPLLLTAVIHHFETDINFLKMYTYGFFVISFIFIYLYFKDDDEEKALLTILIMSVNPYFWIYKNHILADLPHLLFAYIALFLIQVIYVQKKKFLNDHVSNVCIGSAIFLAYSMRGQSIVLLPTLFIVQLFTYKKQTMHLNNILRHLLPYATFTGLVIVQYAVSPIGATTYIHQYHYRTLINTVAYNFVYYTHAWNALFSKILIVSRISKIVLGASLMCCMLGITSNMKSHRLSIAFIVTNIALLAVTPFHDGFRYLIPLIPIFFYFSIKGFDLLLSSFYHKYRIALYYSITALFVVISCISIMVLSFNDYKEKSIMTGPYEKESQEMFEYIKKNTHVSDIITFWQSRVMLLYSGRDSVVIKRVGDLTRADYVVYYEDGDDQLDLDSLSSLNLDLKFENKHFKIFKI